ncbi:EAL domain-containing protein [Kineosporia sp. R_H_3]|uniref:EAL domain-containing protein n=1 Tax=Kineosporia sp. R_H_3 TaxID=1961848 RepID=UPI00117A284C|nr:EAL domain-containing protein [Kineosporia sp. R_H_3]
MSSPQRSRSGVHTGPGGHSWVTGVGAAQDRIRAAAGRTDVVLDRLVHAVSELVDAPATVALLEDGDLVRRAATGDGRLPLGVRVETATSICGEALRTGRPVRVGDAAAVGAGAPDATCCPPARSMLSVPLAVRGTAVGVVALTADRPDWFDGVDENTVTLVAEVAADVLLTSLPERVTPRTPDESTAVLRRVTVVEIPDDVEPPAVVDVAVTEAGSEAVASVRGAPVEVSVSAPGPAPRPTPARAERHTERDAEPTLVLAAVPRTGSGPGGGDATAGSGGPGDRSGSVDVSDDERSVGDLTVRRDVVPEQRAASDAPEEPSGAPDGGTPPDPEQHGALPALPSLGLWQWDAATGLATLSEPAEELTGMPAGRPRVLGAFRALVHPDDVALVEETVRSALARPGSTTLSCTFRLCRRDGDVRVVQLWGDLQRNRNGLVGAVGAVADVTPLLPGTTTDGAAGSAAPAPAAGPDGLADVGAHLRAVRELTGAGLWSWRPGASLHDGELEWSPEMFRLVGLEPDEISPTLAHWHGFVHDEDLDKVRRVDLGALERTGGHGETFRVIGADGAIRHVQAWAEGTPGSPLVHGAAVDVTRQVRDRVRLERLVATDPVTGLANRAAFERRVTEMLAEPGVDVSVLLLDVDRFKQVNDSLGHDVGDRLLLEVARRLSAVVPDGGLVARMGGDEFVVLPTSGLGMLAVRRLAEAVTDALRMPYVLPDSGELLVCPVSLGITSTSGRAVSPQDLLAEAELALYRAKDSGRDRFVVYDEALRARSQSRLRAERLLRGALEHGRLTLQYQPIIDFANGRVVGAEALVRIRDESGDGLLMPDVFIDVAEETGLVVDLDRWVIDTAIEQVERWAAQVPAGQEAPWLSVNVSARSMEHPGAIRGLLDAVRQRRISATDIKVELTERSFLAALPGGEGALRQLLGSGIPVGIDDFGTGYSALGYLQRFELDFMKIDRSFVQSVGEEQRADAVVTAIVDLAHAHGMLVTAEGVETPRQARRLREIGCDQAQGYHFGRPADAARIIAG